MANEYLKLMLWIVCMHADSLRMLCRYSILLFLMLLLVNMIRFLSCVQTVSLFHHNICIASILAFYRMIYKISSFLPFCLPPYPLFCKILLLLQIVSLSLSHTQNNTHTWTYCYYIFTQLLVFSLF